MTLWYKHGRDNYWHHASGAQQGLAVLQETALKSAGRKKKLHPNVQEVKQSVAGLPAYRAWLHGF